MKYPEALKALKSLYGEGKEYKTANQLADSLKLTSSEKTKFYSTLGGKSVPKTDTFLNWLHGVGARIIFPGGKDDFSEYAFIPRVLARPAAGGGSLETSGEIEDCLAFRRKWIRRKTSTRPERLRVMAVAGDSMSPTIEDGDIVLVDEGCQGEELQDGRVYVVRKNEEIYVKRYHKGVGCLLFMGDNRDKPFLDVRVEPGEEDGFKVIGRALWAGKEL